VTDLRTWLAARTPQPPEALMLPVPEGAGSVTEQLVEGGLDALERALVEEGERSGAFELLAADALLTYACESAAAAADPEHELLRILERMARRGA